MDDNHFIEIQRLFEIVHRRGLRELSLSREDFTISISAVPTGVVELPHPPAMHYAAAAAPVPRVVVEETPPPQPAGYAILSPLVGTFYRSPSPDSPAFVEIGEEVEVGQTLCIVEAMKVFNEITTDKAGIVTAFPVQNGQLVQVDQVLAVLETE